MTGDLYIRCDPKFPPYVAFPSTVLQPIALFTMINSFNTLLDSGCTHHIIQDQALFCDYFARFISISMANCGSLDALGSGDVEFCYPFGDRLITFTLHGCLYAPMAPINLLSVGALVEWGMSCLFSPGGITKVFFSDRHPKFPGLTFSAMVTNCLSFLQLDFVPPVPSSPFAFPAQAPSQVSALSSPVVSAPALPPASSFPHLKLDLMLWHHRFGHIGMDSTQAALSP